VASNSKPIVSATTPTGPLVDTKTGTGVSAFVKWMQNVGALLNQVFSNGGMLSPDSIPFPTATSLGGVESAGPVNHEWINAINGLGEPQLAQPGFPDLAGIAAPSQVPPLSLLNGSVTAAQVPALSSLSGSVTASQVPPLSGLDGSVTASQVPPLSALSGSVTASQVPALSALTGNITSSQGPTSAFSGTINTAKLTVGGANGTMTFTNGILTSQVAAS